ncbi:MAG: hypothetical protein RQ899_06670 [Pseudomonadales bacterium]|nr:hypothetical protein [Pseudomonadales bacterium]
MYIQRSMLLLFILIYLALLAGMDWINATSAGWYRPYLLALGIIALSAWLQHFREPDEY